MCYLKKIEYKIVLKDSFWILQSCPKCGQKTYFKNTKKFRVNANGNKLDVWLIYQCEECKYTLNLSIYERQKVSSIPKDEYQRFLDNEQQLVEMYGRNMLLFQKNRMDIAIERLDYDFVKLRETVEDSDSQGQLVVAIHNPYGLKIRPEKQIAQALGLSRGQVKSLLEKSQIILTAKLPELISFRINMENAFKTD